MSRITGGFKKIHSNAFRYGWCRRFNGFREIILKANFRTMAEKKRVTEITLVFCVFI